MFLFNLTCCNSCQLHPHTYTDDTQICGFYQSSKANDLSSRVSNCIGMDENQPVAAQLVSNRSHLTFFSALSSPDPDQPSWNSPYISLVSSVCDLDRHHCEVVRHCCHLIVLCDTSTVTTRPWLSDQWLLVISKVLGRRRYSRPTTQQTTVSPDHWFSQHKGQMTQLHSPWNPVPTLCSVISLSSWNSSVVPWPTVCIDVLILMVKFLVISKTTTYYIKQTTLLRWQDDCRDSVLLLLMIGHMSTVKMY